MHEGLPFMLHALSGIPQGCLQKSANPTRMDLTLVVANVLRLSTD